MAYGKWLWVPRFMKDLKRYSTPPPGAAGHYEWQISFAPHDIDMSSIHAKFEANGHLFIDIHRISQHAFHHWILKLLAYWIHDCLAFTLRTCTWTPPLWPGLLKQCRTWNILAMCFTKYIQHITVLYCYPMRMVAGLNQPSVTYTYVCMKILYYNIFLDPNFSLCLTVPTMLRPSCVSDTPDSHVLSD